MFSFARRALLWLAAAAVKAQDELAALGLDSRLASHKSPHIRAKENIRYELTQPQQLLTSTGLLMEGLILRVDHSHQSEDRGDPQLDRLRDDVTSR